MGLNHLEDLADNVYIVLGAYLCVFFPWTVVSLRQFISSEWKPVRVCRHDAFYHLLFTFLPMPYLAFYITLQCISHDFKEMAGAIVALTFCVLHAVRTLWTLWQLNYFYSWTVTAITALRSQGVQYAPLCQFPHGHENGDANMIADCILVNESVVSTNLRHGLVRCCLAVDRTPLKLNIPPHLSATKMILLGIRARLVFLAHAFSALFQFLRRFCSMNVATDHEKVPSIRPMPLNPVELWITWASVFVAQGLSEWVTTFSVATGDPLAASSKEPEHFNLRRDHFAAEILASAVHANLPCSDDDKRFPNPYFLTPLSQANTKNDFRITKQDMLRQALSDGRAFPFYEPHIKKDVPSSVVTDKNGQLGYSSHETKLQRFLESLPAQFPSDCLEFDVERLEWLTILLYYGICFNQGNEQSGNVSESDDVKGSREQSTADDEIDIQTDCPTETNDFAIQNLLAQLGFDNTVIRGDINQVRQICAYPFEAIRILSVSNNNRHALQVGYQIDAFIALAAGTDIEFLEDQIPVLSDFDPGQNYDGYDERFAFSESFDSLSKYQEEIEKNRLNFIFVNDNANIKFLECSLNFIGYGMELVRTKLARWVHKQGSTTSDIWNSPLSSLHDSIETEEINLGFADKEFSNFVFGNELDSVATHLWVQSKVICLFQEACFSYDEDDGGPESLVTMALCLLSFPSITVQPDVQMYTNIGSHIQRECSQLNVGSTICDRALCFLVIPTRAPQPLAARCTFKYCKVRECLAMSLSLIKTGQANVPWFSWELWKESFTARCTSNTDWKRDHNLLSFPCTERSVPMHLKCSELSTGFYEVGSSYLSWDGWPPFRYSILLFELLSQNFLLERKNRKVINIEIPNWFSHHNITRPAMKQNIAPVTYSIAMRSTLHVCTHVVQETLSAASGPDDANSMSHISRALQCIDTDFERALFILEVGAVHEKNEKCFLMIVETILKIANNEMYISYLLEVLELYASQILLTESNNLSYNIRHKILNLLLPAYEKILITGRKHGKTVIAYAWLIYSLSTFDRGEHLHEARSKLRSFILRSNDFSVLLSLAVIMNCNENPWNGALKENYFEDGACTNESPVVKVCLSKNKNYSHFDCATGNVFLRLALKYAANFENDSLANIMIASNFYEGHSTRKDWNSALRYFSKSLTSEFASVAICGIVNILTKGGYGAEKDISKAGTLLEEAYEKWENPALLVTEANLLLRNRPHEKRQINRAIELYEVALKTAKLTSAARNLATIYLFGKFGIAKNIDYGKQLLRLCINEDDVAGMELYEMWFLSEYDVPNVKTLINCLCERIVKKNCFQSMVRLASYLKDGEFIQQDFELAFGLLQTAVWNNYSSAMNELGMFYSSGGGSVLKNDVHAEHLFQHGARLGCSDSKIAYCRHLLLPRHSEKESRGLIILEDLVTSHNNLWAMCVLARKILDEKIGPDYLNRAIHLYHRVIEAHSPLDTLFESENPTLRTFHEWIHSESGCELEPSTALDLFRNNTEASLYSDALMDLAEIYIGGSKHENPTKTEEATILLKRAVKVTHNSTAMERIAVKLANGSGIDKDVQLAISFLERVVDKDPNNVSAAVRLAHHYFTTNEDVRLSKRAKQLLEHVVMGCKDMYTDWYENAVITLSDKLINGTNAMAPETARGFELLENFALRFKPKLTLNRLGLLYMKGHKDFLPDFTKAVAMFEQNILENDCTDSMVNLAICLFKEHESKTYNPKRAYDLVMAAYNRGNSSAALIVNSLKCSQSAKDSK